MNALQKYFNATKAERKLFQTVFRYLFIAWWNTTFLPMRNYIKKLGIENMESPELPIDGHEQYLIYLKTAIRRASKYAPFKTKCLQQAYAGKVILNSKKIPATIYFGATKNKNSTMKAHAWLRAGTVYISGDKERHQYIIVSKIS